MKELELALLQYQQNVEIPEVNLQFHPVIARAAALVGASQRPYWFEVTRLTRRVHDQGS
jgi:hypothetical protein